MQKYTNAVEVINVLPSFSLDEASTETDATGISNLDSPPSAVVVLSAFQDSRRPIVIRGIDIGPCTTLWTPDYLKSANQEKKVKVHRSKTPQLDFRSKNFVYETISFTDLIQHCNSSSASEESREENSGDYLYLRSLGLDPR